ncbi:MAG: serine/threonine protein kinase [Deltaproteobacteria bacterium]|nr:serine/threonine protein kinase [Deltaproteobacteria bacterium]
MAEIYLASQSSLAGFEKLVVVKRILPNLAGKKRFVDMFLDEARIAAMLNHPNVVQIFDLGRIDGHLYMAMEYLSGESMSTVVKSARRQNRSIPPHIAAGMILQAAEGLQHAHTLIAPDGQPANIVHRDISPQNLFVLYDGGVKVVDFGIAKAAQRNTKTRTGMLKGKYSYMSPEQIQSKRLDGRSDVFALGVVLWELLTRRKLFNQENDLDLLKAITEKDAPMPRTINPGIPPELERITSMALQRNVEDRYESAAALRAALAAFLKASPHASDTVAIGNFMQKLFVDRIKTKRNLVEGAKAADRGLDDDFLFGDISQYLSDTEHSIPSTTPAGPPSGESAAIATSVPRSRHSFLLLIIALVPLIFLGVGLGLFWERLFPPQAPKPKPDIAAGIADAGVNATKNDVIGDIEVSNFIDGGTESDDGNATAATTDPGDKPHPQSASLNPENKKNRKRRRQKRKRIDKPKNTKGTKAGPPGKLRLMTNPWTEIYYKGKKQGQTPLVDITLPSGRIKLKAVNKEAGIDRVLIIQIPSGGTVSKRFNLF